MSLRPDPTIRVFMTGLMAVTGGKSGEAPAFRVGMNLSPSDGKGHHGHPAIPHSLGITIMPRVNPPKIAFPIYIDSPVGQISLRIKNADYPGLRLYPADTFDGKPVHPHDIRWGVILDGKDFHNQRLDVLPGMLTTQMTIDSGELYTADRFCVKKAPPVGDPERIQAAYTIGINIHLNSISAADLVYKFQLGGPDNTLPLVDINRAGELTKFDIYVGVLPAFTMPDTGSGHFQMHYDAFSNYPDRNQWYNMLGCDQVTSPPGDLALTYARPCIPLVLSQTELPPPEGS
jgi:hypothetical protein